MKRTLSAIAQSLAPPILWNSYLRLRGLHQPRAWQQFNVMMTASDTRPLLTGRFGAIHDRYYSLNPFYAANDYRYRHYNACYFASICRAVPGDFVCAGVSYGASAKVLYEFLDFGNLGKTLHLVDPFAGTLTGGGDGRVATNYNRDPDYVMRQFPAGAPVVLHRQPIPIKLPRPLAFIYSDVGENVADDAAALPIFYEALSPGGIWISNVYADDIECYQPALDRLGVTPLWLPSGQGVVVKPR